MKTIHIVLEIEERELSHMGMVGLMTTILSSSPVIRQATGIKDPEPEIKLLTEERNTFCNEAHTLKCKIDWMRREAEIVASKAASLQAQITQLLEALNG